MCGIAGIYAYHYAANSPCRTELIRVRDYMMMRGPDSSGTWFSQDGRVGLGHRRLSIIDLSDNATQPMASADGRYVVTFNGVIYNYKELRQRLEMQGWTFRTASDTEVLLLLFAQKGADMVSDLRGMFAFAIWDRERRSLFLARDPYGIKPLYYADDGWTFRFASQVKALLAGGGCGRDPDPAGLVGFHLIGSVPEPYTTVASIRALPAGATLLVDRIGPGEERALPKRSVIFCGHILMVPLAAALSRFTGAFLWLQVHGDDAWPAPLWHVRWGAERSDLVTSVSRYTRDRMIADWWKGDPARIRVLPNTVHDEFQPGPKPKELIARHGLAGKKVLLTVSRIAVTDHYKGHDRVIAALPAILQHHPEAVYVIAGDGDGAPRLNALVGKLGLTEHVRFVGRVPAGELVDHYRLADVFIMPSTREGFGIVFLEAASCGLHVIGGKSDGSWDALREGHIGDAIDSLRQQEIIASVCRALEAPNQPDPKRASVFSTANFRSHVAGLVAKWVLPQATTA
jgi:glycosyltransferase involved in cell wall biosynthesis